MSELKQGDRLKDVMAHLKIEGKDFAEAINKTAAMVSTMRGSKVISETSIRGMSDFLKSKGVNPDYLRYPNAPLLLSEVVTKETLQKEVSRLKKEIESLKSGDTNISSVEFEKLKTENKSLREEIKRRDVADAIKAKKEDKLEKILKEQIELRKELRGLKNK